MFRYEEPPRKVLVREATEHFNRAMMMTIYFLKFTDDIIMGDINLEFLCIRFG